MNNKLRSSGPRVNEPRWCMNEHYWNNYAVAGCALPVVAVGSEAQRQLSSKDVLGESCHFLQNFSPFMCSSSQPPVPWGHCLLVYF